ncbi:hypothetical protein [Nocardia sp. NPDC004123]
MTTNRVLGRIGWAAQALVAASAVVTLAAAPASAGSGSADSGSADPGFTIKGNPAQLQVGTSYELDYTRAYDHVPWMGAQLVNFYDNGQCIGWDAGFGGDKYLDSTMWTPTSAGAHTLQVAYGPYVQTMTVTVQPAASGAPIPKPTTGGCGVDSPPTSTGSSGI